MKNKQLRALAESAILTAAAMVLSYIEIPIGVSFGGFGGSLSLVMIPILICALRLGVGWGLGCGLVFGTLKFFFSGGTAINWESMLLDYTLAYTFVGLAGFFRNKSKLAWVGALVGCFGRFVIHFISGVTIYAEYAGPIFGIDGGACIYSLLYNGSYMLPSTVLTVIAIALLQKPLEKLRAYTNS